MRGEVEDFDRYLREPWGESGSRRIKPPKCVENHLRAESGNQCLRCGSGIGVQTAHIVRWEKSRSNHHHNLVRVCSQCHVEHDEHGSLSSDQLRKLKQEAVNWTRKKLRRRMQPIADRFRPPPADSLFAGRQTDVRGLRDALRANRSVLVRGAGGIGKTQTLLRALDKLETGRPVVWIEVERYDSVEDLLTAFQVLVTVPEGEGGGSLHALAERLDELNACVVLDGVEQLTGPSLDEVDDLLERLTDGTANALLVATSQVDLNRTLFDYRLVIEGLGLETSRSLLRLFVGDMTDFDAESENAVLASADGHPLALRLMSAQIRYFGSARVWLLQMRRLGARAVEIPKRANQNRTTSLTDCLSLSYNEIEEDERRLLYLIASCPGGIYSAQLTLDDHGGADGQRLLAALKRWSLVETTHSGQSVERSHVLSPIRLYVRERWRREHPSEAGVLGETLASSFGMMAIILDHESVGAEDLPHMLGRIMQELPNLIFAIAEAEAQPGRSDLGVMACGVCAALMRFYFVLRLPEQGSRMMMRGFAIAMRDGHVKRASEFIARAISLARRSNEPRIPEDVESTLDDIRTDDAEVLGNVALSRAMIADVHGDSHAVEAQARAAIGHFETVRGGLAEETGDAVGEACLVENGNDLSSSFQLLGSALLAQGRAGEASSAYGRAMEFLSGSSVAVNAGQILYQIGRCRMELNEHSEAADFCARAAVSFQAAGMREYLSRALGGLGYALMEVGDDTPLPNSVPSVVLTDGLLDAAAGVERCLAKLHRLDHGTCDLAVRTLFWVVVSLSLSDQAGKLEKVAGELRNRVANARSGESGDHVVNAGAEVTLRKLERLSSFMGAIPVFERRVRAAGRVRARYKEELWKVCADDGGAEVMEWLDVYLRRKWADDV